MDLHAKVTHLRFGILVSAQSGQCSGIAYRLCQPGGGFGKTFGYNQRSGIGFEHEHTKGRNGYADAEGPVLPIDALGLWILVGYFHRPSKIYVIAIEDLDPGTSERNLDFVHRVFDRRKITYHEQGIGGIIGKPEIGQDAVVSVVSNSPLEALLGKLPKIEGPLLAVEEVQLANPVLQTAMGIIPEEVPAQFSLKVPFVGLTKLLAHKQEFGTGMGKHIPVEQSELGKLVLFAARHFINHGGLSVDYLIV